MKVSTGLIPPGGWHYPVLPGVTITADTHEQLLDKIFEWKLRNGHNQGNIRAEVDRYYCGRWPHFCQKEPVDYGHPAQPGSADPLSTRVARWTTTIAHVQPAGGFELVNQDVADKRAEICAACPRNTVWRTGCRSCSSSTAQILLQLRKLRNTKVDPRLFACDINGQENQTAVHLPDALVKPSEEEKPFLPPNCWKNTL